MPLPKTLREVWEKNIKPLFVTERRETLFGHRYNKMQTILATLGQTEKDRLSFYMAASAEIEPVRDYVEYIKKMESFCALCVLQPDSNMAKGLDMKKMTELKTAVDLLANAMRNSDKPYLDRVRKEMPVPTDDAMTRRVRSAEIGMLAEDILPGPRKP